jgi:NTE family protein
MSLLKPNYQYNLGYALSGGGSRGFAHLGVLKKLDELDLKPDIVVGTSAGALAGVFYADGFQADEISELFRKKEFTQFAELTLPKSGFFKSTGLYNFLKKNLRAATFEQLKIPFISVTTDWERARTVAFSRGDKLIEAVVASCTVPIVFQPQFIDNVAYVDGGVFKNFPVSLIRRECKYVIGVNVSQIPRFEKANIRKMSERTFRMMANANTLPDREMCDILIEPRGISRITMFDLKNIEQTVKLGYLSADEKMKNERSKYITKRCLRYRELSEMMKEYMVKIKKIKI